MNPIVNRVLMAYRPLYLHGLLMDGQYKLPSTARVDDPSIPAPGGQRRRMLLVALAGLRHVVSLQRNK